MSNTFGTVLKVSTFGESHGWGIGGVLDGCPAGIFININDIKLQLNRRRPKQYFFSTKRKEKDNIIILSGINNGITMGTPIAFYVKNENVKMSDYKKYRKIARPSHGDYTFYVKYGIPPLSGGGRLSARETVARIVAGAVVAKFLKDLYKIEIVAWVSGVGDIAAMSVDHRVITMSDVDKNPVRCPDDNVAFKMNKLIVNTKKNNDSVGGIISCVCRNIPAGWGEPVFDKLEAKLAYAMLSIPASKGFEIGTGFLSANFKGSHNNDSFVKTNNYVEIKRNIIEGINGGISTGNSIFFRVAFKPPSSVSTHQKTVDFCGNKLILEILGRHDVCIVPRAVPIVEAMTSLVLGDFALRYSAGDISKS